MTTIIGYTDSINECDCCGKVDLKGTYCVEVDGVEFYFGSVCAFKNHGIGYKSQKEAKKVFTTKAKAVAKFDEMESVYVEKYNSMHESFLVKMLKFVEANRLDLMAFFAKYGKVVDENNYYTAYQVGCVTRLVEK